MSREKDETIRLIPCRACHQTGWLGGGDLYSSSPDLIGLPPFCDCCHGRGYVSWSELQAYRERISTKYEWLDEIIESHVKRAVDEHLSLMGNNE